MPFPADAVPTTKEEARDILERRAKEAGITLPPIEAGTDATVFYVLAQVLVRLLEIDDYY
jgi:hypothetical protein